MERTHRWAERCLAARTRADQAVFGIIQGGVDPALRTAAATAAIASLPFDGIAIGGLSVGETQGRDGGRPWTSWPRPSGTTRGRAT